jgi:hypothetical protein
MVQASGLKRSMPCDDLCSMMVKLPSPPLSPVSLIKEYDSDDASATSCMELSSMLKLNSRIIASYEHFDSFIDHVWDFQGFDDSHVHSNKRQKCPKIDSSSLSSQFPATEALSCIVEESEELTLDKLMNMHIHRITPSEMTHHHNQPTSCLIQQFSNQNGVYLSRLSETTMA